MSPDYDASREIDRLESRFNREMDRRFAEVNEKLVEMKKQMESIETKLDAGKDKEEDRLYEKHTWSIRQVIIVVLTFIMGGGALSVIQTIVQVLSRR
jgi:predicted phage tail protein